MIPNRSQNTRQTLSLLRWLRHNPQHSVPVALLTLYLGAGLIVPRHKSQSVPASLPPPAAAAMPTLINDPPPTRMELANGELLHTLRAQEGRDIWRIEIWWPVKGLEVGEYAKFYKNGRLVYTLHAHTINADGFEFGKAAFKTRYPLLVLQGLPAAGHLRNTILYTIRRGRLIEMGEINGQNHGPVFRDYDGDNRPEWVFDDYNWYVYYEKGPKFLLVYKELKNGKLKLWKTLPNPKRRELPERLGRNKLGA